MAKFDPQHAVVPPTNFGDKNSAERFLECGKFRRCANLTLVYGYQRNPLVSVYLPVCRESRFERTGWAQAMQMPGPSTPTSPVTYTTVAQWAPLISCPRNCKGYRSQRWARILRWIRPKATQKDIPASGVLSNGWVQGFGVTSVVTFAALVAAIITHTAVQATAIAFVSTAIPTLIAIVVVRSRMPRDRESGRNKLNRRPQQWEALVLKFRSLVDKPIPIWGQWTYTFETGHYEWSVRHSSETAVKLCIEICKEAGRLLLAEPSFRKRFPNIVAITDDGDRWLVAIYKVAGIGKVTANSSGTTFGVVTTGEGGEIKDLPGASQVLCQMALNGF
jgi:membrane protein implicated in regulation of membrane protease activity